MITMSRKQRIIVTTLTLLMTFLCLLNQTMMMTALPLISNDMHVNLNITQWLVSGYILIIGVITPLTAGIYKRFSNRQLVISALSFFTVGTLLGCFANNFAVLLAARLLQAVCNGLLFSFSMTTMVSIYPAKHRGTVIGTTSMMISLGTAFGPVLGGLIINGLSWHYLFYLMLPCAVLILVISWWLFPNYSQRENIRLRFGDVLLSLSGLGLFLTGVTLLATWVVPSLLMILGGLVLIGGFVYQQLHAQQPLLQINILRDRSFRIFTLIGLLTFMLRMGAQQLILVFAEKGLHIDTFIAGLLVLPGSAINAFGAPIVGKYYDKHGNNIILIGLIVMLLSTSTMLFISGNSAGYWLAIIFTIMMIGYACIYSPALSSAYHNLTTAQNSEGVALNTTLRQTAGAIANTVLIILADWPHSFVLGFHNAIIFTLLLIVIAIVAFVDYRCH